MQPDLSSRLDPSHLRTYRLFVKGVALFAVHVLVVLVLLAILVW